MNGVIMVLASITLTIAMSFATVPRRHRRIQRADPSRQNILPKDIFVTPQISGRFGDFFRVMGVAKTFLTICSYEYV